MARVANKLTARFVVQTKRPGLYPDGEGLFLQVTVGREGLPRKSWLVRYTAPDRRRREMGLGRVEHLDLAAAREAARKVRSAAAQGEDPIEARRSAAAHKIAASAKQLTFQECAEAYVDAHGRGWRNAKHRAQWASTLSRYAYPVLGSRPVGSVDQSGVMEVLEPLWTSKVETGRRLRGRIEAILDWATVRGHRSGENPARWRGFLEKALPSPEKVRTVRHHRAMAVDDLPGFYADLTERTGAGADGLRFLILTAARFGEVAGATWGEIDPAGALWTIPARRMKAGREHRVPLARASIALLRTRFDPERCRPGVLIFGSDLRPSKPLSDMTLTAVLRRMGRTETSHGFRSTFRVWAAERTSIPREVAEAALAHVLQNAVEAAYRRTDFLDKRIQLMSDWASFCLSKQSVEKGKSGERRASLAAASAGGA